MSNCAYFQSQIASIMEVLAKTAVAEITKLVDEDSAELRLELCRGQKEIEGLKRKLQLMENELRVARGCRAGARESSVNISLEVQVCEEFREKPTVSENGNCPAAKRVFDERLDSGLTGDGTPTTLEEDDASAQPVDIKYESADMDHDWPELLCGESHRQALERSHSQADDKINGETTWGDSKPTGAHGLEEGITEPQHWEEEQNTQSSPAEDPGQPNTACRFEELHQTEASLKQELEHFTQTVHQTGSVMGVQRVRVGLPDKSEESTPSDKGFTSLTKIGSHRRVGRQQEFFCQTCGKVFTDAHKHKLHQQYHSVGKRFACTECGKSFIYLSILEKHQRIHTGEKPFACTECEKSFSQWHVLKTHESIHTGVRPYVCTQCGKCFRYKGYLKIHQRVHTREKPFTCKQCGKCFSQLSNLKTHQITHTGEKSYSCTQCNKTFSYLHVLKHHQSMHAGGVSFNCKLCGKMLNSEESLKQHQIVHHGAKRFSCTLCGKGFTVKSSLKAHQSVHTGEKPFSCTECGKTFAHRCNLKTHQRVHTGEKPFTCTQCGKSFSQNHVLQKHILTHSSD